MNVEWEVSNFPIFLMRGYFKIWLIVLNLALTSDRINQNLDIWVPNKFFFFRNSVFGSKVNQGLGIIALKSWTLADETGLDSNPGSTEEVT